MRRDARRLPQNAAKNSREAAGAADYQNVQSWVFKT
jgi:hypothetical protein